MSITGQTGFDVELTGVAKRYGGVRVVEDFTLAVPRGSFTTLLGPSGCGKTTLLRMIAGFFEPDAGTIRICGKDQRGIPPEKRSAGMVFQDYALFPHLTVGQNLAYGLTIRKTGARQKDEEVRRVSESLGIGELLGRYPGELSGGQQQRVALGRALVLRPQILLMDEPLSNLDAKLRVRVREELKDIQRRLGITTIYVTHDQEEALSLSDYIAVMRGGALEQMGTPREVYNAPRTVFAADITGAANFLELDGKTCMARPEWLELADAPIGTVDATGPLLCGAVEREDYFGGLSRLRVRLDSGAYISVDVPPERGAEASVGQRVWLTVIHRVVMEQQRFG